MDKLPLTFSYNFVMAFVQTISKITKNDVFLFVESAKPQTKITRRQVIKLVKLEFTNFDIQSKTK